MFDERLEKLANLLVNYSTEIKKGDKVSIRAEEVALPFVISVARAAIKKGAFVDCSITIPEVEELILKLGNKDQISYPHQDYGHAVRESDVWITSWGSKNFHNTFNIEPEVIKMRKLANRENRKVYMDRIKNGELRWVGTLFPTDAGAQEANMSLTEYENFVFNAGMLNYDNTIAEWNKIRDAQEIWCEYLSSKSELKIVSRDTNLTLGIKDRKWVNCCGKENFPDGEIFTSPIEDSVNGEIYFNFPAIYDGKVVEDVRLKISNGKITDAHAKLNEDFLISCINTDEGSGLFGEVAIGTNYNIKQFTKNILFDEKMGGNIHLALGCGFPEAGGKNFSSIHWDMICGMRESGKIFADNELFYSNGEFLKILTK